MSLQVMPSTLNHAAKRSNGPCSLHMSCFQKMAHRSTPGSVRGGCVAMNCRPRQAEGPRPLWHCRTTTHLKHGDWRDESFRAAPLSTVRWNFRYSERGVHLSELPGVLPSSALSFRRNINWYYSDPTGSKTLIVPAELNDSPLAGRRQSRLTTVCVPRDRRIPGEPKST